MGNAVALIRKNSATVAGAALGVMVAPWSINKVAGMINLGSYGPALVSGAGALLSAALLGKRYPGAAAAVAGVFLYYTAASLAPALSK